MKRPPVIIVQLIHIAGPLKGEIQEFSDPVISIGRHPSCNLSLPANLTNVSRKHAEIIREGNQFKLIDHSVNGTFVNGKRVKETYLKNGDVLEFSEGGPKTSFLTEVREDKTEIESVTPPPRPREKTEESFPAEPSPRLVPKRYPEEKPDEAPPFRQEPVEVSVQPTKVLLVIQYGPTIRSFKELPVTIGKNPKSDFIIDHPAILDQHAQIFFSQNQYWIKDLTGQGTVHINRVPIPFQAPLKLHDDVSLSPRGPFFRFLGEGRLAEVEEPLVEEPTQPSEKERKTQPEAEKGKRLKSIFKKMLDH